MNRITLLLAPLLISGTTVLAQEAPTPMPTQDIPTPSSSPSDAPLEEPPAAAANDYFQSAASSNGDCSGAACDTRRSGCDVGNLGRSACDAQGGCDNYCGACCGDGSQFQLRGWINAGMIWNTDDPTSNFNGPYNAVDRATEPMLNQIYLSGERALPGCGIGVGGRIDLLYGEDYFLAESIGMERRDDGSPRWNPEYYGFALPQAYLSVGNENANIQVGHFYSIVGYESLMAPENFFYSKSYSYQFAGPFTHWGVQGNVKVNQCWTVQLGIHNGWDALDRESDRAGFVGKVRYDDPNSGIWTSFAATTGDEFNDPAGLGLAPDFTNRSRYSWIVGVPVNCCTEYVFHHWYGTQENGARSGSDAQWYGVDQYLYRTINHCLKAGVRFEWFRDEDGTRVGLNRPSNPNVAPYVGDFYSLSFGLNYRPMNNLVIRPDVRFDWYDGDIRQPFDDGNSNQQTMFGIDAILSF